jgi:hypothetical protein
MDVLDKVNAFKTTDIANYKYVVEAKSIGDIRIIAKICNNMVLFHKIDESECKLFTSLPHAFFELDLTRDALLIQFVELDLYGIFTLAQYKWFIESMNNKQAEGPLSPIWVNQESTELRQLVLTCEQQKFVFACYNKEQFDLLRHHASNCFGGAKTNAAGNQIAVNIIVRNKTDAHESFEKLFDYVQNSAMVARNG